METIPESISLLKKKKVEVKASNNVDNKAIFLSNITLAIKYVINKTPTEKIKEIIFPNKITSRLSFQKNPRINGQIMGLDASHNPAFPKEKIYFPIPT